MSIERIATHAAPHLLIGGYGMGFTLRAALAEPGRGRDGDSSRTGPADHRMGARADGELAAGCLDDPRVRLVEADVAIFIAGAVKKVISGRPDPKHISTSFAERQNLAMRMHMRRFLVSKWFL